MVSKVKRSSPPRGSASSVRFDYPALAVELIRALRGRRSLAEFSRRIGYRSNVAHRWEARRSWPSAARYLAARRRMQPSAGDVFTPFFQRTPAWLAHSAPDAPAAVAAFLRQLVGKTPIARIAELGGFSRYQVSRWLSGRTQPDLPEFLCLIEVSSRRLLDWLAIVSDPARLPSAARRWQELQAIRSVAYEQPWSHAVLRALEIEDQPSGSAQIAWLAGRLGLPMSQVEDCLRVLRATQQVEKRRGRQRPRQVISVTTAHDQELARQLKTSWTRTALERLEQGLPGNFGYSLFAASRADLRRLRDLHLEYVRAMQQLIADSQPNECVGLFCAQLLDLSSVDNALAI